VVAALVDTHHSLAETVALVLSSFVTLIHIQRPPQQLERRK
jgi:hypothetical protein